MHDLAAPDERHAIERQDSEGYELERAVCDDGDPLCIEEISCGPEQHTGELVDGTFGFSPSLPLMADGQEFVNATSRILDVRFGRKHIAGDRSLRDRPQEAPFLAERILQQDGVVVEEVALQRGYADRPRLGERRIARASRADPSAKLPQLQAQLARSPG